ncbi:MAG: hypothetical protein RBU21_18540 [FCB group bacterium]|nr:hypothetical protein [FCB group bacterium]
MNAKEMQVVVRDERTVAVESAGLGMAYNVLSFALLIDVIYRGLVLNEAAWDLLALGGLSGFIVILYQARQKALPHGGGRKYVLVAGLWALLAAVVAAISAILTMHAK